MADQYSSSLPTQPVESCPACGGTERVSIIEGVRDWFFGCVDGDWSFAECASCRSLYLDPRLTDASLHNAYATYYTHEKDSGAYEAHAHNGLKKTLVNIAINTRFGTGIRPSFNVSLAGMFFVALINDRVESRFRYFPRLYPGAEVLDVGCGSGRFLKRIADAGWLAFGVDLDPVAVQQAKQTGLNVQLGDISAARFFDRRFDAITLCHVIEHVPDIKEVLDQALMLLKPGGFLHLEFPNPQCEGRVRFGRFWRGLEAPRHLCLPSRKAIEKLLGQVGYRRIKFVDTNRDADRVNAASLSATRMAKGTWSETKTARPHEPTFLRVFAWG